MPPAKIRSPSVSKYLKPKHAAVLQAAAQKVGYGTPAPQGVYRGVAQIMANASYVAACAEVSVNNGRVKVHRMVGATNPGHAVNPEQIARQVEGSFVYGLSSLLYGECTVRGGRIEQTNFDTWDVMRLDEMPKVEVVVMPDGEFWGGVRRTDHLSRRACGAQRHLCGNRQAYPKHPDQKSAICVRPRRRRGA